MSATNKTTYTTQTDPATKNNPKGKSPQRLKSRKKNQFGRLAMQYYPGRGYKAAVRAFREELRLTRGLMDALTATGYKDTQRLLSPRQIRIIEDYLGEPRRTLTNGKRKTENYHTPSGTSFLVTPVSGGQRIGKRKVGRSRFIWFQV